MAQPQFWLRVRKDYVMDNFDNLISYLRRYDYHSANAPYDKETHRDFRESLKCMEEISDDIFSQIEGTPIYEPIVFPYDNPTIIRLLAAIILASRKCGNTNYKAIIRLATLIICANVKGEKNRKPDFYTDLQSIIIGAARREYLDSLPISWADIDAPTHFMEGLFIEKFRKTRFRRLGIIHPSFYYENDGLLLLPADGLPILSPLNRHTLERDFSRSVAVQITVPDIMEFRAEKGESEKTRSFKQLFNLSNTILSSQKNFTLSPEFKPKTYDREDAFLIKVTEKLGYVLRGVTIDPNYEPISGKINLKVQNENKRPDFFLFHDKVKKGDYLWVSLSDEADYAFCTEWDFETYYRNYAADCHNGSYLAIPVGRFSQGEEWLSEEGVHFGIHNHAKQKLTEEELEEYEYAFENNLPIHITFYSDRPDTEKEEFNMYAMVGDAEGNITAHSAEDHFTKTDAFSVLIDQYLADTRNDAHEHQGRVVSSNAVALTDTAPIFALYTMLWSMSELGMGSSLQRLQTLVMSEFMSHMLARQADAEYFKVQRMYLRETVGFAANESLARLQLPSQLAGHSKCLREASIIDTLTRYEKRDDLFLHTRAEGEDVDTLEAVTKLVNASNSLIDIIEPLELNNIKEAIAKTLGVADEFESILESRTHYGREDINLELKSSSVFPPANRRQYAGYSPEPEVQKWAILKTVCGFLNSRTGGELLLGVNDAGYAVGLYEDMQALAKMKYISTPDLDHYRNYLQTMFDNSFCRDGAGDTPVYDIARSSIRMDIKSNAEKRSIISIKVEPYGGAIVALTGQGRPAGLKSVYVRSDGRTVEMTETLREVICRFKGISK